MCGLSCKMSWTIYFINAIPLYNQTFVRNRIKIRMKKKMMKTYKKYLYLYFDKDFLDLFLTTTADGIYPKKKNYNNNKTKIKKNLVKKFSWTGTTVLILSYRRRDRGTWRFIKILAEIQSWRVSWSHWNILTRWQLLYFFPFHCTYWPLKKTSRENMFILLIKRYSQIYILCTFT